MNQRRFRHRFRVSMMKQPAPRWQRPARSTSRSRIAEDPLDSRRPVLQHSHRTEDPSHGSGFPVCSMGNETESAEPLLVDFEITRARVGVDHEGFGARLEFRGVSRYSEMLSGISNGTTAAKNFA